MLLKMLAAFAVSQRAAAVPPDVGHAGTRAIIDWFSATIAGSGTAPVRALVAALVDGDDGGSARLVPSGRQVPPRTAALINGTASHVVEFDDIYREGTYHPGAPTVAAALAATEKVDGTGEDLLRGVVVGYEIGDRIAAALAPAHYRFWHPTGTVGTIGAAAAAAAVLRLDEPAFAHALATSATMAAGLQQAFRSEAMSKPLHAGHAAEAGLLAALAAQQGFTGALDVIDGPIGLGAAMSNAPSWDGALDDLGTRYLICETTVKNHACCGHTFAAVDAAIALRDRIDVSRVAAVSIDTYATAKEVAGIAQPTTAFEAKFSLSYCVAVALAYGSVRLHAFTAERLADPTIHRLMAVTTVTVDDEFSAVFPGQRAARVAVTSHDGGVQVVQRGTRKGDPDDPLSDDELQDKFEELVGPVIGPDRTALLSAGLWRLPELGRVRSLDLRAAKERR